VDKQRIALRSGNSREERQDNSQEKKGCFLLTSLQIISNSGEAESVLLRKKQMKQAVQTPNPIISYNMLLKKAMQMTSSLFI
jgi:hypothetical protein